MDKLNRYRPWFYAAAAYNAIWGVHVMLWPTALFNWLRVPAPTPTTWFQCIGMMVGVYAIGFLIAANKGDLPWAFGWINVFNDVIWLPAFSPFATQLKSTKPPSH